jgi:hypothetical protein
LEVFLFRYAEGADVLDGVGRVFESIAGFISKGDSVAVKVHMGERGNITYLRPIFVRKIVDLVKQAGGKPFVTDTTTLYPKNRFTAEEHLETAAFNGFTAESVGAPIVIADGDGYNGISSSVERVVDGCELRSVRVARAIAEADALIVLSHFKGHDLSGFGGALKNIGMGCVTKDGKAAQHMVCRGAFNELKCNGCGVCAGKCVFNAMTIKNGKPSRDDEKCMSCNNCLFHCPQSAWYLPEGVKERFQVYLAHAASAVLRMFRDNVGFINFIQDITPLCDCCTPAGRPVAQDVGIAASIDPVAIDKASIDLIDQSVPILEFASASPPDILGKLNKTDSLIQLRTAEKLGIGSLNYDLIEMTRAGRALT